MALIKCGHEVSSLAPSCPNCGAPIKKVKEIKVYIHREKRLQGNGVSGSVFIDQNRVGTLSNGSSFYTTITPGNHTISTECTTTFRGDSSGRGDVRNIVVPEKASLIDIEIYIKMGWSIGTLAIGQIDIR